MSLGGESGSTGKFGNTGRGRKRVRRRRSFKRLSSRRGIKMICQCLIQWSLARCFKTPGLFFFGRLEVHRVISDVNNPQWRENGAGSLGAFRMLFLFAFYCQVIEIPINKAVDIARLARTPLVPGPNQKNANLLASSPVCLSTLLAHVAKTKTD